MINQIEVTTRCNYSCWYCTGRQMEQKDMSWETFLSCLEKSPHKHVILQGEGEPTLWPHFYKAAEYLKSKGYTTETTMNGTVVDVEKINTLFDIVSFTIDNMNEDESKAVGRPNVKKVISNILALAKVAPRKISINTVDIGQDFSDIVKFCRDNKLNHRIFALNKKTEYVAVYPQGITNKTLVSKSSYANMACYFVDTAKRDYFNVEGLHRPCCFIKHSEPVNTIELKEQLAMGVIPFSCTGCSELKPLNR